MTNESGVRSTRIALGFRERRSCGSIRVFPRRRAGCPEPSQPICVNASWWRSRRPPHSRKQPDRLEVSPASAVRRQEAFVR